MRKYSPEKIESKWQKRWEGDKLYITPDTAKGRDNFYALVEFAYPSGDLHAGHWYAFAVNDIFVRQKQMAGKNVMFPIGFDAFGLPAENAALKHGKNPREWTYENMDRMRGQLRSMGTRFDWSREVVTCEPEYYKWTQWFFAEFFKNDLAYQAETEVNWCASCRTVLANEQVVGGACERCKNDVEQKKMKQWMLRITKYAQHLIDDLDELEWKDDIKLSQKNWIGKSSGAELHFTVDGTDKSIEVFTTRPDTLFGVTYMVLAPEHGLIDELRDQIANISDVEKYIKEAKRKTNLERQQGEKEKTGVLLDGVSVINPATNQKIPVYIADYVLASYGTGAIMAVPAHDARDFEFAKKFDLPVKIVVEPITGKPRDEEEHRQSIVALVRNPKNGKVLSIEWSKELGGNLLIGGGMEEDEDPISCAKREIQEETGYANVKFISQSETIHHHYFAHSKNKARNIDAIGLYFELENEDQNEQQLEEDEKNKFSVVWLSENEAGEKITDPLHQYVFKKFIRGEIYSGAGILTESGEFSGRYSKDAILAITKHVKGKLTDQYKLRDWVVSRQRYWGVPIPIIHCDDCGAVPVPEKDLPVVLPGIEDYKPTGDGSSPLAKATDWVNVKCPTCKKDARRETDTLDTFVDSSWYFLRYCDPKNTKKFADKKHLKQWMPVDMYSGGAEHTTMHLLYSRFFIKAINDLGLVEWKEPYTIRRNRSLILGMDGQKMSKSQGNVINPDEYVEKLGADTLRMYLAFLGPYDEVGSYPWNTDSILGIRRFLDRIWRMAGSLEEGDVSEDTKRLFAKTVKKVGNDIERLHFNTAISALMVLVNHLEKNVVNTSAFSTVLQLLAPFAPHMSEELWCNELGRSKSIHSESWPVYDERLIKDEQFELVVQVNGKVRAQIIVESDISETDAKDVALGSENVQKYLDGNEPKKVIYVAGKLVNIVV